MIKKRFPKEINSLDECLHYYQNRSIQLLPSQWTWDGNYEALDWG